MFDGIFGDIFDFDGDGRLDIIEQAAELAFIADIIEDAMFNNSKILTNMTIKEDCLCHCR